MIGRIFFLGGPSVCLSLNEWGNARYPWIRSNLTRHSLSQMALLKTSTYTP